jgi:hypothetical protein
MTARPLEAESEEHPMRGAILSLVLLAATIPYLSGGCTINLNPGILDGSGGDGTAGTSVTRLESAVGIVQTTDPRDAGLPDTLVDAGDTVLLDPDADVIVNVERDLVLIELPDSTILGFDNQTGLDIYVRFLADNELQSVYVYDGETLLLDYPCLSVIELLSEDDILPGTGVVVDSFPLYEVYVNPDDFICGDAVILPFESQSVDIVVEYIDLVD